MADGRFKSAIVLHYKSEVAMAAMDWDRWRDEFPSCSEVVHMNHAGIAPTPV